MPWKKNSCSRKKGQTKKATGLRRKSTFGDPFFSVCGLLCGQTIGGVCFLDLTVYTNDVISPGLLPGRRRIFLPRTLGLFGAVFVRSLYFHALLFSFARLDLHKQSLSFSSHHNSSLLCDILLNKLNICPFRNLANQFGNKSADLHREPVGHLNLASKSRGA